MIRRKKHGRGFSYLRKDNSRLDSKDPTDQSLRRWIKSLAIPPAWTDVEIDEDQSAKVHACGRDSQGRKQYIYNAQWAQRRQKRKFSRLEDFVSRLSSMRITTARHLQEAELSRNKALACMVRLLDIAYFRPGNPQYTQKNDSYGLTTMRSRHMTIENGELFFRYQGKSNVEQEKRISDPLLIKVVSELDALPGYRIFKYLSDDGEKRYIHSEDLNAYIHELMGESFSAKDFRTWAGTALAAIELAHLGPVQDKKKQDKNIVACVKAVAKKLGNTPAICRANYIYPKVLTAYSSGSTINTLRCSGKRPQSLAELSEEEFRVFRLLQQD